jgi:outer membrane protein assembly factor BamB
MAMQRRTFLRAVGTGAAAVGAGCASPTRRDGPLAAFPDAMFRGGLARRGVYPERTIPESVTVDWTLERVNTGDHTAAKASAVQTPDGNVVLPGDSGRVWSLRPDGTVRWRVEPTDATRGFHGTPAIANGMAYLGAYDGVLYGLDLESGDVRWRTQLADAIGASPAYHEGTVYIAVEYAAPSGALYGVDAGTGTVTWKDPRPTDHPHSSPAIDREAGAMVVGSNDGRLYGWTYPDPEFAWTFQTGGAIKGPIATYDGGAFFGSWDEHVYRVDLETGEEDWAFAADGDVMVGPSVDPRSETVYVGSHDSRLYALDVATGEERWSYDTGGMLIGCPTVTREHVLVGSYDRHLYALTLEGELAWTVENRGWVTSTPLVTEDAVYYAERRPHDSPDASGYAYRLVGQ